MNAIVVCFQSLLINGETIAAIDIAGQCGDVVVFTGSERLSLRCFQGDDGLAVCDGGDGRCGTCEVHGGFAGERIAIDALQFDASDA